MKIFRFFATRNFWTGLLAFVVLAPCVVGFVAKFYEMCMTLRTDPQGIFVLMPMVNYLAASAGFGFLFAWAIFHGMFKDIEAPKFELLSQERILDSLELAEGEDPKEGGDSEEDGGPGGDWPDDWSPPNKPYPSVAREPIAVGV